MRDAIGQALLHHRQFFGRQREGVDLLAQQHAERVESLLLFGGGLDRLGRLGGVGIAGREGEGADDGGDGG